MGPEARGRLLRTEGRAPARTRGRPARSRAVPRPPAACPASSSFAGHGKEARAGVGPEPMALNPAQDARCCVTFSCSVARGADASSSCFASGSIGRRALKSAEQAALRHGFSGRIFSLKTQEQPDLQTVALAVLPGSGHPPRAARRPDRPHRKGPNQGPQGSHAPWNREGPAAWRSPLAPRPRAGARGGHVCCGRAEDRDTAWRRGAPRGGGAGGGGRGRRAWPLSPFHRTLCPYSWPCVKGLRREPAGQRPAHALLRSSESGGVARTCVGWAWPGLA